MNYSIKTTDKSKFQAYSDVSITMKDAKFIDNLLGYQLPKNIRALFIDILSNNGYWEYKRNKT